MGLFPFSPFFSLAFLRGSYREMYQPGPDRFTTNEQLVIFILASRGVKCELHQPSTESGVFLHHVGLDQTRLDGGPFWWA